MAELLQLRAYAHDPAAHCGSPAGPPAHDFDHTSVVQADDDVRGRPPAGRWGVSAQIAARPTIRSGAGEPLRVLPALCRRDRRQGSAILVGLSPSTGDLKGRARGSRPVVLLRSRDYPTG